MEPCVERSLNAVRSARHYALNREKKLAWMREYYARNRERIKEINLLRKRRYAAERRARARVTVVATPATPEASPEDKGAGGV